MSTVARRGHFSFESAEPAGRGHARLTSLLAVSDPPPLFEPRNLVREALLLPPYVPDATIYRGVRAVFNDRTLCHVGEPERPPTADAAVDVLREAIDAAIGRAVGDARTVAVMTGGGLDSGGLLALMVHWARTRGVRVFAVALDFASSGDDRPHLAALERHLGCDVVRVQPEEAAPYARLLFEGVDASPVTFPTVPCQVAMLARARENGAECVLTGVGGDALFDGDAGSLARLLRSGKPRQAVRAARSVRGFDDVRFPTWSRVIRPTVALLQPRALRLHRARSSTYRRRLPPWAGSALKTELWIHADTEARRSVAFGDDAADRAREFRTRADRRRVAWLRNQQCLAAGIDRCDPFMDPHLSDFVTGLPPEWLLHGGIRRGLFRAALRGLVPESFRMRVDKAELDPAAERWVRASGGFASFRSLLSMTCLADLGAVEPTQFAEDFERFVSRADDGTGWARVFPALAVEAFLRGRERMATV